MPIWVATDLAADMAIGANHKVARIHRAVT